MDEEHRLGDPQGYLQRLAAGLHDKLRVERYLLPKATRVLDVGCADGALTLAIAARHPAVHFLGIDLDAAFIERAQAHARQLALPNVEFRRVYLRELLAQPVRFDCVVFASVLHEFWTYGEGISSVLKALADAHELVGVGGTIVIRDMVLESYTKQASWRVSSMLTKVLASPHAEALKDFEQHWGQVATVADINHLMLKYRYKENWTRELPEHYVPVTSEQYMELFTLLGMRVQTHELYLLPFLREQWQTDFGLDDDELALLRSTALLVAQRESGKA